MNAKKEAPAGPWWKKIVRAILISLGTALVVKLVDTLLYPEERAQ